MKYVQNSLLNALILSLVLSVVFSACKKDPVLDPRISDLKVCDAAPTDEVLCASHKGTFAPEDDAFYASAKFIDISKDTDVTFSLLGKDSDGNWEMIADLTFKPSQQGTFEDETSFDLSTNFTKNATAMWTVTDYKVETKIELTDGPTASKEFDVQ